MLVKLLLNSMNMGTLSPNGLWVSDGSYTTPPGEAPRKL